MFSSRIPLNGLIDFCRSLRYLTEAGLTLAQAMKQQGKKGPLAVRPVAARMAERLERGTDLQTALRKEAAYFPPVFLALSAVGEDTGRLPDVLRELENFFALQAQLKRQFLTQIAWPVFQFIIAVLVLTLLIWILGMIADMRSPGQPPAITVFGMYGGKDAMIFLCSIVGVIAFLATIYWFVRNVLKRGETIDRLLLRIPAVGGFLQSLALNRFSMSMYLTIDAGVPIKDAARLSLEATGNHAYASRVPAVERTIASGDDLTSALTGHGLFPAEYLAIVETAEIGGREPEVFKKQAEQYHEHATRRLKALAASAAWGVWLLVAIFIIAFIFSIFNQYLAALNQAGA